MAHTAEHGEKLFPEEIVALEDGFGIKTEEWFLTHDLLSKESHYQVGIHGSVENWKMLQKRKKEIISFSSGSFETGLDGMTEAGRRSLLTFLQKKNPSFRDFQALKTHGMDKYSAMKKDTLMEYSKAVNMEKQLEAAFPKEAHRLSAIRWMLRGLSPDDAIHKVMVDAEIADNARHRRWFQFAY